MKGVNYVQLGQRMIKGDMIAVPKNVKDVNILERENVLRTDQSSIYEEQKLMLNIKKNHFYGETCQLVNWNPKGSIENPLQEAFVTQPPCVHLEKAFPVLILMTEAIALPAMNLQPSSDCTVLHIRVKGRVLLQSCRNQMQACLSLVYGFSRKPKLRVYLVSHYIIGATF